MVSVEHKYWGGETLSSSVIESIQEVHDVNVVKHYGPSGEEGVDSKTPRRAIYP